ncbi:prolipoprotein diacylglyceryl transferase [Candidatus Gracilibacteria bacterium]|nr:prolipoprotein diacylglyceryl transferase [Candidatus Gracilibacteria bacterium]
MYPIISLGNWITIYTFGLLMIIAWAVFFMLLHYFSLRRGLPKHIFDSIIDFTLAIFFFGRIFYIFSAWRTEKFLFVDLFSTGDIFTFLKQFFITDNYSLSFAGGVVGFLTIFLYKTWNKERERPKYWDSIIPAFLIAASIGYIGALLGGQIYGIVLDSWFSIYYTSSDSIVPFQNPTFPLPVLYSIFALLTAYFLYRIENKVALPEGLIGYMGMGIFATVLFLGEFLNGASDLFSSRIYLGLTQIIALCIISYALVGILRIMRP